MSFAFFVSFFPFICKAYVFALSPTNSDMMAVVLVFQKAKNFFICDTDVDSVIARVKFTYAFHDSVDIVIFCMVYEAINIDIHNFAFFIKQRYHVLVVKVVQIRLGCTYPRISICQLHLERSSIATRFSEKTLR